MLRLRASASLREDTTPEIPRVARRVRIAFLFMGKPFSVLAVTGGDFSNSGVHPADFGEEERFADGIFDEIEQDFFLNLAGDIREEFGDFAIDGGSEFLLMDFCARLSDGEDFFGEVPDRLLHHGLTFRFHGSFYVCYFLLLCCF